VCVRVKRRMTRNYPRHFCYATYSTYMHVWPKNGDPSTASASCNNHTHTLACMRNVDYDPLMDTYSNSNTAAHRRRRPYRYSSTVHVYCTVHSGHIYTCQAVCTCTYSAKMRWLWSPAGPRRPCGVVVPHNDTTAAAEAESRRVRPDDSARAVRCPSAHQAGRPSLTHSFRHTSGSNIMQQRTDHGPIDVLTTVLRANVQCYTWQAKLAFCGLLLLVGRFSEYAISHACLSIAGYLTRAGLSLSWARQ